MPAIELGDVKVSRVLELEAPVFGIRDLLPDMTDEIVAAEKDRLAPRWLDPDSGRLISTFQSYVIETPRRTILVDTGIGNGKKGRRRPEWNDGDRPFLDNLHMAGYRPRDIDLVVLTHIHVDHVGWNTVLSGGRWVPTFPRARYAIVAQELKDAERKAGTEPARYAALWADSILPVLERGLIDEVPPDHAVDPSVKLAATPGHTANHVAVWIGAEEPLAVITGDVLHHPVQARHPELNSRACELGEMARTTRRMLLDQCADEDALALPIHFEPCRVRHDGEVYEFLPP